MNTKRFFGATKEKQREAILEMMTGYFIDDIRDRDAVVDQAALILHEDFDKRWKNANRLAEKFVDELWFEAEFNAEAENAEARDFYETRESALADAAAGRW